MGGSRRAAAAFAVAAIMMASQTTAPAAEAGAQKLPSVSEAVRGLVRGGIDRSDIVVQRGIRNYAGAYCPGEGWDCTTATSVVQHSGIAALNIVECSPDGTTTADSCSVVQVSNGGTNEARCEITDTELSSLLTCSIDQTNTSGPNSAETVQTVTQSATGLNITEGTELQSSVQQDNQSGSNTSTITQTTGQSASLTGPFAADHHQDARFCASVHQTSTSGPNDSDIDQTHTATSDILNVISAKQAQQSAPIVQQPCADGGITEPTDFPNIHAVATQFSDTGPITQTVDQIQTLDQGALSVAGPTSQLQGPAVAFSGGGLAVEIDGDTDSDTSNYTTNLKKSWTQDATSLMPISQVQNDREVLSGIGLGFGQHSYRDCTWLLDTNLTATQLTLPIFESDPSQTSSQRATAHCTRSMDGTISSNLNGSQDSRHFEGEFVNEEVNKGPGAPAGGPAPFPHMHKAVVNDSRGEPFDSDVEVPNTTEAFPGEQIRYRLTAHNHGEPSTVATGASVRDAVPEHMTFDAAASTATCSATGTGQAGDVVTCLLSPIPGGASAAAFVVFDLGLSGYDFDEVISNKAHLKIDGAPEVPSNTVLVTVKEPLAVAELHKAVRNDSTGGPFLGLQSPSTITALPGHFIRYRLTAHNHGHPASLATGVSMSEVVPAHMTAYSCTSPCAITGLGGPGETVSWLLPDMPGGSAQTRDVVFQLDPVEDYTSFPTDIGNVGFLTFSGAGPVSSNSTTVTVEKPLPVSGMNKAVREVFCSKGCSFGTFSAESTTFAGQGAEYRLRYTNTGPGAATNVVIHDQVPPQTTFLSCPSLPVPCTTTLGGSAPLLGAVPETDLFWELGTVAPGATVDLFFRVDVDSDCDEGWTGLGDFIDNVADADTGEEPPLTSNNAKLNVMVSCIS